jgi:uncharacterized repeat protein (TIGR01451 family)
MFLASRIFSARRWGIAAIPSLAVLAFAATPGLASAAKAQSADLATTISPIGTRVAGLQYPTILDGSGVAINITVTNKGLDYATNVLVTDSWIAATFGSVSATAPSGVSCTRPAAGTRLATCTVSSLAPHASLTMTAHLRVSGFPRQLFNDTATATSATLDPDTANDTATVVAEIT